MLPLADAVKVKPVGSVEALVRTAPVADVRQEAFERSVQSLIGQKLQGEILSRLNDGTFLVRVAGTATRMALPDGAKAGTSVPMTLVSLLPRPTFLLGTEISNATASLNTSARPDGTPGKPLLVYSEPLAKSLLPSEAAANSGKPLLQSDTAANSAKASPSTVSQLIKNYVHTAGLIRAQQGETNTIISGTHQLTDPENASDSLLQTVAQTRTQKTETGTTTLSKVPPPNILGPHAEVLATRLSVTVHNASASLSPTGQLINHLLQAAQESNAPTTLLGKAPLVNSPKLPPEHVAATLRDTLTFSGLFYESHVAQWAGGKRSMAELMREPQMQANSTTLATQANADTSVKPEMKNVELTQLINLQLNTLEHQNAQWRGEIWPGQAMEWEVSKDAPEGGNDAEGEEASWQSAVRFNFPTLGTISAVIYLTGEHLRIQVNTTTEGTADALQAHVGALSNALSAAGSTLDSFTVKQDDDA